MAHRILLPLVTHDATTPAPRLRLGVGIAHQRPHTWRDAALKLLQPPVWKDWLWDHRALPGYSPAIFSMSLRYKLNQQALAAATGELWELGNEPEQGLSMVAPAVAAEFGREWARVVGDNFAAPGIIIGERGLAWLEQYLAAGGPVGACWNVHIYWAETPGKWLATWRTWCAWQAAHGLERPSLVSETSGEGADVGEQMAIMTQIAGLLRADPRLHTVLWYSDRDWFDVFPNANLVTEDASALTKLGEHYRALVAR